MGMPVMNRQRSAVCSCVRLARQIERQPDVHSVTAVAADTAPVGSITCAWDCGLAWYIIPTRLASLVADALQHDQS